jgi:hypothetical protein
MRWIVVPLLGITERRIGLPLLEIEVWVSLQLFYIAAVLTYRSLVKSILMTSEAFEMTDSAPVDTRLPAPKPFSNGFTFDYHRILTMMMDCFLAG